MTAAMSPDREHASAIRCDRCERHMSQLSRYSDPYAVAHVNGWLLTPSETLCPGCAIAHARLTETAE